MQTLVVEANVALSMPQVVHRVLLLSITLYSPSKARAEKILSFQARLIASDGQTTMKERNLTPAASSTVIKTPASAIAASKYDHQAGLASAFLQ